jgi:carbamoyltransferase
MHILGLSAFYHDSAAALIRDGEIVAACQEERFTRKKADADFPAQSVAYCLKAGALKMADIDEVVFYDKPFIKFERLLETFVATAPRGFGPFLKAMPVWLKQKLWMKDLLREELGYEGRILFGEHHESHAASAFYPSPFEEAAVLTVDGVGEWATTSMSYGHGHALDPLWQQDFPHSLGLLYSAFTYYTGFKVNSGEYKVMGLAPYGEPKHVQTILDHVIDLKDDGSFRLNMEYFNFHTGLTMTSAKFHDLFGGPPREPETKLTPREMDLARSVQDVTELVMLRMARHAKKVTGAKNLCLAGGVALNCVANGKVLRDGAFERVWIQPAAGDAGGALGTALAAWHIHHDKPRTVQPGPSGYDDAMRGSYLGPAYSNDEIAAFMAKSGAVATRVADSELASVVAAHIADEKVIGWFQGRMEYGPRALGARSILGDARSPSMQKQMNLKIKFRESFRPFAPVVLVEDVGEYFELDCPSPYMLLVADVQKARRIAPAPGQDKLWGIDLLNVPKSDIPAVTHVDYSARVQTVDRRHHPRYYDLIAEFKRRTGCAVLVNTSFNVRGEPIVCTPHDAYLCFMRTEIDVLVMENWVFLKADQPPLENDTNWREQFVLD